MKLDIGTPKPEKRNHLGLLISSQPGIGAEKSQFHNGAQSPTTKPIQNKFNWKWDK